MIVRLRKRWIVADWSKAASVWLLVAANVLVELVPYLPEIQEAMPADWYKWAFRLILIARIYKQNKASVKPHAE